MSIYSSVLLHFINNTRHAYGTYNKKYTYLLWRERTVEEEKKIRIEWCTGTYSHIHTPSWAVSAQRYCWNRNGVVTRMRNKKKQSQRACCDRGRERERTPKIDDITSHRGCHCDAAIENAAETTQVHNLIMGQRINRVSLRCVTTQCLFLSFLSISWETFHPFRSILLIYIRFFFAIVRTWATRNILVYRYTIVSIRCAWYMWHRTVWVSSVNARKWRRLLYSQLTMWNSAFSPLIHRIIVASTSSSIFFICFAIIICKRFHFGVCLCVSVCMCERTCGEAATGDATSDGRSVGFGTPDDNNERWFVDK